MGRIGVGTTFFRAGPLKHNSWEFTVKLFEDEYRVPLLDPTLAARIAMAQDVTVPIFLFLGLATRIATLPLIGMILVIQTFVYPNAYNDHLMWERSNKRAANSDPDHPSVPAGAVCSGTSRCRVLVDIQVDHRPRVGLGEGAGGKRERDRQHSRGDLEFCVHQHSAPTGVAAVVAPSSGETHAITISCQ